jgi:hypothetical protein
MSNVHLRFTFAGETMFPPRAAPFFPMQGTSRFPVPLPAHTSTEVSA